MLPILYAIYENKLLDKVHSGRDMLESLLAGNLALAYADDVVSIAYPASESVSLPLLMSMLGNTDIGLMFLYVESCCVVQWPMRIGPKHSCGEITDACNKESWGACYFR